MDEGIYRPLNILYKQANEQAGRQTGKRMASIT